MTRYDRLRTLSSASCCMCDHRLSVQELEEFCGRADEPLCGEVHCRACAETHLLLCRECSGRYTTDPDGICGECSMGMYRMVG
jgi:hypothetical protein